MASLIKNQILKHLSRFTKNLSPDKINLSTLKGEGELSNLELDEGVLTELLELPTWLKLTKAVCNRVSIKIQWTKLKSQPIWLLLDEVLLEVDTCETPRPYNAPSEQATYRSGGKYGFSDKVIDGMSVAINSVNVNFRSKTFHASLQLSRVQVYSVNPNWQKVTDLKNTRVKDMEKGEILVFKEVDWQTTRIEASGVNISDPSISTTPLRLIANQSKIRITLKKKLHDCSVVSSRVTFLLDDLLWVLTDTQLKAAIVYTRSLQEAVEKSAQQSKKMAAEKLKKQGHIGPTADQLRQQLKQQQSMPTTPSARFFAKYDVVSTSYHLITSRIDLHLCDDNMPTPEGGSKRSVEGGAMQVTLQKLSLDYYPYHPAGGERKSWYRYADNLGSRNHWVQQLFSDFKEEVRITKETCALKAQQVQQSNEQDRQQQQRSPAKVNVEAQRIPDGHSHLAPPEVHGHRSRSESAGHRSEVKGQTGGHTGHNGSESGTRTSPTRNRTEDPKGQSSAHRNLRQTKLLESCFVLKLEEFTIFQVSLPNNRKKALKKFLCSDKKQLHLPPEMSVVQLELTEYFFTEGIDYPVPHPNLYILINPVRLTAHYNTVLWANYFFLNLAKGIKLNEQEPDGPQTHMDLKLEAVMPRLVLPSENRVPGQLDRPDALQLQVSRLSATNCRVEQKSQRQDLGKLLNTFSTADLFSQSDFPNDQNSYVTIPQQFCDHAAGHDNPYLDRGTKALLRGESTDPSPRLHMGTLLKDKAFDIWSVTMDQIWLEFTGVPSSPDRPVSFVESIPLTIWFCSPLVMRQAGEGQSEQKTLSGVTTAERTKSDELHPRRSHRKDHNSGSDLDRTRASKKLLRQHYTVSDDQEYVIDPMYHSPNSLLDFDDDCDLTNHLSPHLNDQAKDLKGRSPQLADLYMLLNFKGKLRAQINHYQYLFVMRLLDSYTDFQKRLESDAELLMPGSSSPTNKMCAALSVEELEFALVCPAVPQPSVTPSSLTYSSPLTMVPTLTHCAEGIDTRGGVELHVPSRDFTDDSGSAASVNVCNALGTSPSHLVSVSSGGQGSADLPGESSPLERRGSGSCPTFGSGESMGRGQPQQRPPFKRTSSAAEVKKSLTTAWTALSDKLKARSDLSDDSSSVYSDYDSISINTDMSSDDDFDLMGLEDGMEAPAFEHHGIGLPPEIPSASETASATPDDMALTGVTRDLLLSEKAKEHVSVVVFKMTTTEVLIQSVSSEVTVRAQISHMGVLESGNIVYEDFNNKFATAAGFVPVNEDFTAHPPIRLKYMQGGAVGEVGFLDVRCQGLDLHFLMSSLTHMADLVEDEIIPKPLPMSLQLLDLGLHLKEDRPPSNFTSPGPVPMDVQISQLTITRGDNGVFHVRGEPLPWISKSNQYLSVSGDKLSAALNQIPDVCLNERLSSLQPSPLDFPLVDNNLKLEVERLTEQNLQLNQQLTEGLSQIAALDELKAENQALRTQLKKIASLRQNDTWSEQIQGSNCVSHIQTSSSEEENNNLIERISFLEDELKNSTKEKDSLVATLRLMQEELLRYEAKQNSASPSRQRSPRR